MPKTRFKLLQSLKTKNCIDVTNTRWHFLWTMFSACTSIKVAVLLNKVADLPKEHFSPLDPILYFQLLFLRLLCCCGRDLLILPAGTGTHAPVHMAAAEIAWISFQLDCRRSAASLSASNVSCVSQTYARMWGSDPCFSFPHPPRVGAVLWILLFLPLLSLSYRVSHYSFPVVRYSCPLSAGVLQALSCLKVYSWWIPQERSSPPPSCSRAHFIFSGSQWLTGLSTTSVS